MVGEWINLADDIDHCWAAVTSVMIVRLHKRQGTAGIAGVLSGCGRGFCFWRLLNYVDKKDHGDY